MRDVVPLLQRLVACNTSNPPGNEAQAAAILEAYLEPLGIECERVSKDPERPNLIARLPGRGGGPSLAFLGHLDVVQARREDWSVEPFAGVLQDGAIWGRGAVDMKCQVAATAVALGALAAEGFRPNGDLLLVLTADEEVGDAKVGAPFLVKARPDLAPDFVVGEGAGERYVTPGGPIYLVDRGVKGTASAELVVHGEAADASLAGGGRNAIDEAARLLARLASTPPARRVPPEVERLLDCFSGGGGPEERVEAVRSADPDLGAIADSLTSNVFVATTIEAQGPDNVVPEVATAGIYGATLPGEDRSTVEAELRRRLGEGEYDLDVDAPEGGLTSSIDTPLFRALESFLAEHDPDARLVPALGYGYSDCNSMRGAYGSTAYGFIPFRHAPPRQNLTTKHAVDERVLVDDLLFQVDCALHVARTMGAAT